MKILTTVEVLKLATQLHSGQKRINGDDYITHPIRVSMRCMDLYFDIKYEGELPVLDQIQQIALLHDVLEDCPIKVEELINLGVNTFVVQQCNILNKNLYSGYDDYIAGVINKSAEGLKLRALVKYCDLLDNLSDIDKVSPEKSNKKEKYLLAKRVLGQILFL